MVGVELSGLQPYDQQWRALIAAVRGVFPGTLTYAANWDAYDLSWWDALDLIGVDAYMPLTTSDHPTDADLAAGWDGVRGQLQGLHDRWHKRLLLTEIGYPETTEAAAQPWGPRARPIPVPRRRPCARRSPRWARCRGWPAPTGGTGRWTTRSRAPTRCAGRPRPRSCRPSRRRAVARSARHWCPTSRARCWRWPWSGRRWPSVATCSGGSGAAPSRAVAEADPHELERVLLRTLAAYDAETAEHCERVGRLAGAVGVELGLPAHHADRLRRLGALHDVGKLRVPVEILRKPGRLTPEERAVARQWGAWSSELVAHVPDLANSASLLEAACQLDERTPLDAQIIAACDALDSMTHRRPFRPAIRRSAVVAALAADRRLDPRIVAALERHAPVQDPESPDQRRSWAGDEVAGAPPHRREDIVAAKTEP